MTLDAIVDKVANRMGLTTATSLARIAQVVNEGYKEIMAELRLNPVILSANTVIGNRNVTFTGAEKLLSVFDGTSLLPLNLLTMDQLRNMPLQVDPATGYVPIAFAPTTVTIMLSCVPATVYPLGADAGPALSDLTGSQIPQFMESFQNALIYKGQKVELEKQEKWQPAAMFQQQYVDRVNDMKHYLAVSSSLRMYQGVSRRRR